MRIWLDPSKMANYGLVPADVTAAINEQSLEAAAGQLGENAGESFQYTIRYSGKYKTETEYENIVIKSFDNGQVLRLKDVADIELGSQSYGGYSELNGMPAAAKIEEHTSELQSRPHLVCRLLLEKKKKIEEK